MKQTLLPKLWLKGIIVANIAAIIFMVTCVWGSVTWFYATSEKAQLFFWAEHNVVNYYDYGMIVNIAAMMVNIVSAILLLKQMKLGFWLYLVSNIIIVAVMVLYGFLGGITTAVSLTTIGALISPILLYIILRIKDDNLRVCHQLK